MTNSCHYLLPPLLHVSQVSAPASTATCFLVAEVLLPFFTCCSSHGTCFCHLSASLIFISSPGLIVLPAYVSRQVLRPMAAAPGMKIMIVLPIRWKLHETFGHGTYMSLLRNSTTLFFPLQSSLEEIFESEDLTPSSNTYWFTVIIFGNSIIGWQEPYLRNIQ